MSNWNHSVFYYNHSLTDMFDKFIVEVLKEINYLEDMEEGDSNDYKMYRLLNKIADIYEECQQTEMLDI